MPLFPLDAVRNARPDRELEPLLEDIREEVAQFTGWDETGLGSREEILEAFDLARPRLNVLASLLSKAGVHSCVDISTGLGFLPRILQRFDLDVVATERDPAVSAFARGAGIDVRQYSLGTGNSPVQPGAGESVVFAEVLEHLKLAPVRTIREAAAMLRPGGLFLLTTPNIARLDHLAALMAGENFLEPFAEDLAPGDDPTDHIEHVREYSVREVVEAVEGAGLEVRQVLMTGWGETGYDPLPNPHANQIVVVEAVK